MILSAVVTVGVLGLVEVGLGFAGTEWSKLYQGSPYSYWELRPNLNLGAVPHREEGTTFSVQTNDVGLRDGPLPTDAPWVLALGCSTTFGWGVDDSEAWPEVLESRLGVEVVNAGVPGHTTHQGLQFSPEWLNRRPSVVVFGWGLRDGSAAHRPDSEIQSPRFPQNTQIYRRLKGILPLPRRTPGENVRVGAVAFAENLRALVVLAEAQGIRVALLDMTTSRPHSQALDEVGSVVVRPQLDPTHRFESDPIHFTVSGNRAIAEQLEGPIRSLLKEGEPPQPVQPGPPQTP